MNEETYTFESLFTSIQAGRFYAVMMSDDLKSAKPVRSLVGLKRDELMVSSNGLSVLEVCSEFGKFVRFSVELCSHQPSEPMLLPNALYSVKNVICGGCYFASIS